ncbi:hypothetical protein D3C78_1522730 [compost metagenome]
MAWVRPDVPPPVEVGLTKPASSPEMLMLLTGISMVTPPGVAVGTSSWICTATVVVDWLL